MGGQLTLNSRYLANPAALARAFEMGQIAGAEGFEVLALLEAGLECDTRCQAPGVTELVALLGAYREALSFGGRQNVLALGEAIARELREDHKILEKIQARLGINPVRLFGESAEVSAQVTAALRRRRDQAATFAGDDAGGGDVGIRAAEGRRGIVGRVGDWIRAESNRRFPTAMDTAMRDGHLLLRGRVQASSASTANASAADSISIPPELTSAQMNREGFRLIQDVPPPFSSREIEDLFRLLTKLTPHMSYTATSSFLPLMRQDLLSNISHDKAKKLATYLERAELYVRLLLQRTKLLHRSYYVEMRYTNGSSDTDELLAAKMPHIDGGFVTISLALKGPGTVLLFGREEITAPTGTPLIITARRGAKKKGVPATLHMAPPFKAGQERLILFIRIID